MPSDKEPVNPYVTARDPAEEWAGTPEHSQPTLTDARGESTATVVTGTLTGQTLVGRYVVGRELGHGGVGRVYLARDKRLVDRPVVVKVLLEKTFENAWAVRKFQHEKEALARVDHPGVIGVLDAGETPQGEPYIVMQYVDGVTLRSEMRPGTGMDLERVARIVRQTCAAVGAAHDAGVLHRDLKPENVMLQTLGGGEEQVKVIDFGIAKVKDSVVAPSTVVPALAGTALYMAPEQFLGERVTAATDVYALGVIAYEAVTGRRPFNPETDYQLTEMQRAGPRVAPKDLRPSLTNAAQSVILKALSFRPEDRHASVREFGEALARALADEERPVAPPPVEPAVKPSAPVTRKTATPRALKLGVAAGAALLLAVVGFLVFSGTNAPRDEASNASASASAPRRQLNYWLTVQKMRDDRPYQEPFDSSGQEIFESGYKFRFNAVSPQAGHLYLFNEGLAADGDASLTILYPTPVRNGGSSRIEADQTVQTGWNRFDGLPGTEQFWVVWAAAPVNELEAAKEAAFKDPKGALEGAHARAVRALLKERAAGETQATKDTSNRRTAVSGAGDVLVRLIELEHR